MLPLFSHRRHLSVGAGDASDSLWGLAAAAAALWALLAGAALSLAFYGRCKPPGRFVGPLAAALALLLLVGSIGVGAAVGWGCSRL